MARWLLTRRYRLTGDRKWQEKGWKMFAAWMEAAQVDGGISSIKDVTKWQHQAEYGDNMESFIFAETFKYHYLLQSEPDLISLDDYVLNTEAHTLIANQAMKPGDSGLWTPAIQELGTRGEGTDAQKWMRLKALEHHRRMAAGLPPPGMGRGGGGPRRPGMGMGGGGGNPNFKPKPPGVDVGSVDSADAKDKGKEKEKGKENGEKEQKKPMAMGGKQADAKADDKAGGK